MVVVGLGDWLEMRNEGAGEKTWEGKWRKLQHKKSKYLFGVNYRGDKMIYYGCQIN